MSALQRRPKLPRRRTNLRVSSPSEYRDYVSSDIQDSVQVAPGVSRSSIPSFANHPFGSASQSCEETTHSDGLVHDLQVRVRIAGLT